MPRYFFDFHGVREQERDDEGCEFPDLEHAYLDAYRSMVRIGAEQLLEQHDPSRQWINIRDENDFVLMTVAFDEVFRRRSQRRTSPSDAKLNSHVEHNRRLREEIREACLQAKASLVMARQTLDRANVPLSSLIGIGTPVTDPQGS